MSETTTVNRRILVLVKADDTAGQTTIYALREARDLRAETGDPVTVDIRVLVDQQSASAVSGTVQHIEEIVSSFDCGPGIDTTIELVEPPGEGPERLSEWLRQYIGERDISRLVLDADTEVSTERLRESLGVTRVELAPTDSVPERRRLLHPGGLRRFATIFGVTYLFYLSLGGFAGGLDLMTGAISAGVVGILLSQVALSEEPRVRRTGVRIARMFAFLPVLLWEVVKANFVIAYIILHPRLPVDPSMDVIETDAREGVERMVLANSITLTPGTLTVAVEGGDFTIHSLTAGGRSSVQEGRLQRLVGWVFHGSHENPPANDGSEGQ